MLNYFVNSTIVVNDTIPKIVKKSEAAKPLTDGVNYHFATCYSSFYYGKMKTMEIEKTNRMNALFEFYAALLTDKQMNYIELYYADDYSLAEIAEEFGVSRQAVYDNIKRTEKILEAYEMKLHMYSDYIVRSQIFDSLLERYPDDAFLQENISLLTSIDNRD